MAKKEELPIFINWMDFVEWLLPVCEKFPKRVRFTFADRIINLSLDIVEDLVEAQYSRQKIDVLVKMNLRLETLRILIRLCNKQNYMSFRQYEHAMKQLNEVGRMLGGWLKNQKRENPMKRAGHLFETFVDYKNLYVAAHNAARGKKQNRKVAYFMFHLEKELFSLQESLKEGVWQPGGFRVFRINDPKPRQISAADFRDRVVHHAVCNIIGPHIESRLIFDTWACRPEKGSHAALKRARSFAGKTSYFLKCDIKRYFDSVDHEILKTMIWRIIKDRPFFKLLVSIIDCTPPIFEPGKGLPIGNLTSQYFANLYLDLLDHEIKDRLGVRYYLRYMDDMLFLGNKEDLKELLIHIEWYVSEKLLLSLKPEATILAPVNEGMPFLGFKIFPGIIRLNAVTKKRFIKRIKAKEVTYHQSGIEMDELRKSVQSMTAHMSHGNTLALRRTLFSSSLSMG